MLRSGLSRFMYSASPIFLSHLLRKFWPMILKSLSVVVGCPVSIACFSRCELMSFPECSLMRVSILRAVSPMYDD